MQIQLKKIKNRPQLLLSFFGAVIIAASIALITYLYDTKSEEILYKQVSDQLSAVNKTKLHALSFFLSFRESDIRALASSETILNLCEKLKKMDEKYNFNNLSMDEILAYKEAGEIYYKYNKYLHLFLKEYIYKDALLIDKDYGHIVFSAHYKQYVGKNLNSEEFKNSEMTRLWREVIETESTSFSDIHISMFDPDEPVMFIATPVFKDNKIISVLMLKLPSSFVNQVLHFRASEMQSFETYAVGKDYLLRSDSSLKKDLTVKKSFNDPKNYSVVTENVDKALKGQSGVSVIKDYRGIDVISAYMPFEFHSIRWAVVSEIDEIDITKELSEIEKTFYMWTLIISILVFIIGYFLIKKILAVSVINPLVSLYEKAKGFEDIINNSINEIYIFSKNELYFIFANYIAINNSGFSIEELEKMRPFELEHICDEENFLKLIEPLLSGEKIIQVFETLHRRKDGTLYDVQINLQLIEVDGVEKFVAIVNNITEHKKTIQEKEYYYELASYDYLTKIFNRQKFDKLFNKEVERSRRYGFSLSLVIIDIDFFKKINDTFGHQAGDEVLKTVSAHIKILLRDSDVFARWGGEEFVIFMPHTDLSKAVEKAESLRLSIEELEIDTVGHITCSFGVAQLMNFENTNEVFTQADKALYKAKENGRNRVETI